MKNPKSSPFGKRYDVLEDIGRGGMGSVYKVYDTVRNENLALKELSREHIESPAAILGFRNEFRIMSEFRHPNMVQVFEFGMSQENIPIITMEFISGRNLSELSELPVEQIVDILIQTCHALAVIHSRLYVHRDLKPDNIKLLDDGSVKLLDYGLMSQLGILAPSKISGTYYYLAPEVILGGVIDESTDLYSVGIIGYELLTGHRPFTGNRKEILQGHLKRIPTEPAKLRPDISPSVNSILMKLMEKEKDWRYRNCAEALDDLQHLTGRPPGTGETAELRQGYLYSSKLVGRRAETEYFAGNINKLQVGKSSSIFVGSPAGMGKTRLLNEMKILSELEGIPSLHIDSLMAGDRIHGWTDSLVRQIQPLSDEAEIRRYGTSFPWVSDDTGMGTGVKNDEEIAASVMEWIASITQRSPLVLFLDDLHWMDIKSIGLLNQLIRQKERLKLLIVGSFRNDEVGKTSPLWHTVEEELTEYLELAPLTPQQTRTLMENLLHPSPVSDEFSDYCFKNSGGNVFDLIEFLRYMITEGHLTKSGMQWSEPVNPDSLSLPEKLEERLILRTSRLGEETRTLAGVASVLGDDLDLDSWHTVSAYEEDRFFQSIDELMRHQMMIKTNGHYQFGHDKIRAALYERLAENQRADYHLRVATFLEKRSAEDHGELIPTIARHFVAAKEREKAIRYSLQAARAAEANHAEWEAFDHYRHAIRFLEETPGYPERDTLFLEIYEKAAQFSSAAWIDAGTCLRWLQIAILFHAKKRDMGKVFGLSLSYVVTSSITGNYGAARQKIREILVTCDVREGTLSWAILHGAGVCLTDWYQGCQNDCFDHAARAISIFEEQLDTLPADAWPAYSWSLFWRDKARAYLGKPVEMANVEKIRQLMEDGKSDKTIYWHTLTAVTARAASTGRWNDLMTWKETASRLSREMGKIYWFECWISHSYLYAAIHHGEFSQLENHIEKVQASPDPYQVRLSWLFRGMLRLSQGNTDAAGENLREFLRMEEVSPDNSYLEAFIYLARTALATGAVDEAREYIKKGSGLAQQGPYENPLCQLQFLQLKVELALAEERYDPAEGCLTQSLNLAQELDNPIQTGFVRKLWGRFHLAQNRPEAAEDQLNQARDIFLSLENKYQAGQVVTLLESFVRGDDEGMQRKAGEEGTAFFRTVTEDEVDPLTQTQGKPGSDTHPENTYVDTKTEFEGKEADETRMEEEVPPEEKTRLEDTYADTKTNG